MFLQKISHSFTSDEIFKTALYRNLKKRSLKKGFRVGFDAQVCFTNFTDDQNSKNAKTRPPANTHLPEFSSQLLTFSQFYHSFAMKKYLKFPFSAPPSLYTICFPSHIHWVSPPLTQLLWSLQSLPFISPKIASHLLPVSSRRQVFLGTKKH